MQPALADEVQYFTLPLSAATAGDLLAAIRSFPWCAPPGRGAPKSSTYWTLPTRGKTMCSGGGPLAAYAAAVPAARPVMTARKMNPRAVVRWRLIRERALRFASEGGRVTTGSGRVTLSRVRAA